ncbi:MAG: capsular polysaccharide biosynthesis protein [Rhizobiales bacterium]|nr:capsular polysaccharide biosynthesis protein [Hyphomicrobiales bacterium]
MVDEEGVYYDAARPSRLERLLNDRAGDAAGLGAAEALARWRAERLSKYNLGPDRPLPALRGKILLVDQVAGDLSLQGAGADASIAARIVETARERGVLDRLVLRAHPDVLAGKAQGLLAPQAARLGLPVLEEDRAAPALLDEAAAVWTISSALGFEALLRGVPVTTFAVPFYAGWGLSEDLAQGEFAAAAFARRRPDVDLEGLFAAALLLYARYRDPVGGEPLDFHGAVDRIVDWRDRDAALAGPPLACFGFSRWKQPAVAAMFGGAQRRVRFLGPARPRALARIETGERPVVWGLKDSVAFRDAARAKGLPLARMEDGFLRSVGLGSDLLAAGSMALDGPHLYFDASGVSRLETILAETNFTDELRARARALRAAVVARAMTKYNLAPAAAPDLRAAAQGREILLVAAQVADDAAIRLGGGVVAPNEGLLAAVRAERPDAFIVYKEHPDVAAGARRGGDAQAIARLADLVLREGDLGGLYGQIDRLHVVTSLAGFEALMRGVNVTTWGVPFYAFWGLTEDRATCPRRVRRLDLDALTAAALILYPLYADPLSRCPCGPEDYLAALDALRAAPPAPPRRSLVGRLIRWARARG